LGVTVAPELVARRAPSLFPVVPAQGIFWDRLLVVADASTLISDCLRLARCEQNPLLREPLLLHLSRDVSMVRLYATESVGREVEEHLGKAAMNAHLPVESVERAWRDQFCPVLNLVDVAPLPTRDPRLALLSAADLDDVPTGSLAELLGPCLVLSSDPHLVEAGIARKDWGNLMAHAREVGQFQAGESSTILVLFLAGSLATEAGSAAIGLARRAPLPAFAVCGVAAYLLYTYLISERGTRHRADIGALIGDAWTRLGPLFARVVDCKQLLERAAFVPEGAPRELPVIARIVAAAPHPPSAAEIATRTGMSTQKVAALLRNPIFTRTVDRRYVLGRPHRLARAA